MKQGPGGEIGRRKGLKILFLAREVRVQVPPRAPMKGLFFTLYKDGLRGFAFGEG